MAWWSDHRQTQAPLVDVVKNKHATCGDEGNGQSDSQIVKFVGEIADAPWQKSTPEISHRKHDGPDTGRHRPKFMRQAGNCDGVDGG